MSKKKKVKASKKVTAPKRDWKKIWSEKKAMILYSLFVVVFTILFLVLTNQTWFEKVSKPILNGYANISSVILNIFGQATNVNAENILSDAFSLSIKKGCDAIAPMILYAMSIIAFPIAFKWKWKGVLLGFAALAAMNIIRIVSLFFIGKYSNKEIFDIMHVDVWQVLFIIFTVYLWLRWMRWAFNKENINVSS